MLSAKKDKDKANQEHWDRNKDKTMSLNLSLAYINQLQTLAPKKRYNSR